MSAEDRTLDELLSLAANSEECDSFRNAVRARCTGEGSVKQCYDSVAVETARRFVAGDMPFDTADWVANQIYSAMLADGTEQGLEEYQFPPLAFEVFEAFDAGEFRRSGETGDPAETRTRPLLVELLARAGLEHESGPR